MTGLTGYLTAKCQVYDPLVVICIAGNLFLSISGSTILNMWCDRDVDAKMNRTYLRPLPSGKISPREALILGLLFSIIGVGWAVLIDPLYGSIIFAGSFLDVVIYTIWLKRRTAWSVILGGLSGGMPILAGRILGVGAIDWIGISLMLAVVIWIPTHNLTFNMRFFDDYENAGIPTFPAAYGFSFTRKFIALSSAFGALAMMTSAIGIGISLGPLWLMGFLSVGLLFLAIGAMVKPSEKLNFGLFKFASVYMLSSMLLLVIDVM